MYFYLSLLLKAENGATGVEYAIIASLIAGVIIATVIILGEEVLALFATMDGAF